MRVLVHGDSLASAPRLANAAVGLALRGHAVRWLGGGMPALDPEGPRPLAGGLEPARRGLAVARIETDLVIGGGARPLAVAWAGWLVRARCMVLDLDGGTLERWGRIDRWAWTTLHASGLVEPAQAARLGAVPWLDPERVGLWPELPAARHPDAGHPDTEILERACERALARQRGRAPRGAVFADRDGTLVIERGYLSDPADLELLPGVPAALRRLHAAGWPVIVVSNQSGVGRGFFPLSRVYEAMAALRHALRAHGVELDAIHFCPHRPEDACDCRKPGVALLRRAAEDLDLSLPRSVFVGDKRLDVDTGHHAGARGVLVRTGYGADQARESQGAGDAPPDAVCADFAEAAQWILARGESAAG